MEGARAPPGRAGPAGWGGPISPPPQLWRLVNPFAGDEEEGLDGDAKRVRVGGAADREVRAAPGRDVDVGPRQVFPDHLVGGVQALQAQPDTPDAIDRVVVDVAHEPWPRPLLAQRLPFHAQEPRDLSLELSRGRAGQRQHEQPTHHRRHHATDHVFASPGLVKHTMPWPKSRTKPQRQALPRSRGSSASRRPSPTRLKASTATMMASPGTVATCGATSSTSRPVDTIKPHEAVGGCTPRPRNDSAASSRIALAMKSVA